MAPNWLTAILFQSIGMDTSDTHPHQDGQRDWAGKARGLNIESVVVIMVPR